jgi:hypothetical protein
MIRYGSMVILSSLVALGCGQKHEPAASAADAQAGSAPAAGAPTAGVNAAQAGEALETVTGTVVETMDAANYTYMRLQTPTGELWVAVSQTSVRPGDSVTVVDAMLMQNFESRTLKRTFDRILFGRLPSQTTGADGSPSQAAAQTGSVPPQMLAALAAQHAGAAATGPTPADVSVPRAEGPEGRTIAEVYANKATLKDTTIAVRGQVVKYNPSIMGRNWVHIRDGSGSPETKDNDLTLTTQDVTSVGDVVLIRGTLHLDRDFGAGYSYPVIVEDAKLTK